MALISPETTVLPRPTLPLPLPLALASPLTSTFFHRRAQFWLFCNGAKALISNNEALVFTRKEVDFANWEIKFAIMICIPIEHKIFYLML